MHYDVCVIGLGYIGLPTAALFAESGLNVLGVDVSVSRLSDVLRGNVGTSEPGLAELVQRTLAEGSLHVAETPSESRAFVIAVPTPLAADRTADLSFLSSAISAISPILKNGDLVVLESTSPPSTTDFLHSQIYNLRPDLSDEILIAYCPERILPGSAFAELKTNDRVIGGRTQPAAESAANLYRSFCTGTLHLTDAASAEIVKLAENSFRDVNIAFANELSLVCYELGVDPWEVIRLANQHPRVNILNPGPGVGGHCIAVDPWFLAQAAPEQSKLIRTARNVNDNKPSWVIETTERVLDRESPQQVALLGLAFKPNIDDLRESPALEIARKLAARNPETEFVAVEPHIDHKPETITEPNLRWSTSLPPASTLQAIVWLVGHDIFESLPWSAFTELPIIDTRGDRSQNI